MGWWGDTDAGAGAVYMGTYMQIIPQHSQNNDIKLHGKYEWIKIKKETTKKEKKKRKKKEKERKKENVWNLMVHTQYTICWKPGANTQSCSYIYYAGTPDAK